VLDGKIDIALKNLRVTSAIESIPIVSEHVIKGTEIKVNLVWANTYTSGSSG